MPKALSIFLVLACLPAYATSVTVVAEGKLEYFFDPDGLLPFIEPLGAPLVMTFTYDSESPDSADASAVLGLYTIAPITLIAGSTSVAALPTNELLIWNYPSLAGSGYVYTWIAVSRLDTYPRYTSLQMVLNSLCSNPCAGPVAVYSDALIPPPWPADWTSALIWYTVKEEDAYTGNSTTLAQAVARIDSISAVPLPSTVLLLGSGLVSLGGRRWLRRKGP